MNFGPAQSTFVCPTANSPGHSCNAALHRYRSRFALSLLGSGSRDLDRFVGVIEVVWVHFKSKISNGFPIFWDPTYLHFWCNLLQNFPGVIDQGVLHTFWKRTRFDCIFWVSTHFCPVSVENCFNFCHMLWDWSHFFRFFCNPTISSLFLDQT